MDMYTLSLIASDLLASLRASSQLGHFFVGIDPERYTFMMTHIMTVLTRSGEPYDFTHVVAVHKGMFISEADVVAWFACIERVLKTYLDDDHLQQTMMDNAVLCMRAIMGVIPPTLLLENNVVTQIKATLARMDSVKREEILTIMSGI